MTTATHAMDEDLQEAVERARLVAGKNDFGSITDRVAGIVERPKPPRAWYVAITISSVFLVVLLVMLTHLIITGIGVWGDNIPVAWAFDIVNFVFWVGIGHAGTLISAILFLFRQKWRTSINRFAEAMTIF